MYAADARLRRTSDVVFQEADPPLDRSRPVQWRRSFNELRFGLKDARIVTTFSVNTLRTEGLGESEIQRIESGVSRKLSIVAEVDAAGMRDRIYFAKETREGSGLFTLTVPKGRFSFELSSAEPWSSDDGRLRSVFSGALGHADNPPTADETFVRVSAPRDTVLDLASAIGAAPSSPLEVAIFAEVFSHEDDDARREPWMSRDLFVDRDLCRAFLASIVVVPRSPGGSPSARVR
jgi:hypothetical protein